MWLNDFGFTSEQEQYRIADNLTDSEAGRVVAEHKERYIVLTENGELEAEITGNMRFTASGREDFPAVGDWVAIMPFDRSNAIIHKIYPRFSVLKRQAVGLKGEVQVIASNIDYALLVQAVDRDFSVNRLERYLTLCYSSGVKPVIILTKADLAGEELINEITANIQSRISNVPILVLSNETRMGYSELQEFFVKGKTYCLLGSSGVGKSTLLNNLSGRELMKTGEISSFSNRGKHVTSHRELIMLENGALLIDNPGMREVGIADDAGGLETTFDKIAMLSGRCRYQNCTHTVEKGCAVIEAVEKGEIDQRSYDNWLKLEKEREYFETSAADRKKKDKMFGRIVKDYYKKDIKQRNIP